MQLSSTWICIVESRAKPRKYKLWHELTRRPASHEWMMLDRVLLLVFADCLLFDVVWFDSCLLLLATTGNQEVDPHSGVSWVCIIPINSVSDFRVCVCVQWADTDLRGTMPILHFLREVEKFDQGRQLGISCWGSSSKSVGALHHSSRAAGFSCGNDLWSLGTIVTVKLWFGTSGTNTTSPHEALLTLSLSILIRTLVSLELQARLRLWQLFFRSGMNMAIPLPVTVSIFGTFAARNWIIVSFQRCYQPCSKQVDRPKEELRMLTPQDAMPSNILIILWVQPWVAPLPAGKADVFVLISHVCYHVAICINMWIRCINQKIFSLFGFLHVTGIFQQVGVRKCSW